MALLPKQAAPSGGMPAGAPSAPAGAAMPLGDGGMPAPGMESGAQGGERRATDEEKAAYSQFAANVVRTLYNEKTADAIAESLRAGADISPVEGLAQIVSSAVARVAMSGMENGQNIGREMALAATMQAVHDIGTNLAQSAGAQPLNPEQLEAVYLRSVELLAERRGEQARTTAAGEAAMRDRPEPAPPVARGLLSGGGGAPGPGPGPAPGPAPMQ